MITAVRTTQSVIQNSANGSPSTNGSTRFAKKMPTRMPRNGNADSACVSLMWTGLPGCESAQRDVDVQAHADRQRTLVDHEARVMVRVLAAGADERVAAGRLRQVGAEVVAAHHRLDLGQGVAGERAHQRRR